VNGGRRDDVRGIDAVSGELRRTRRGADVTKRRPPRPGSLTACPRTRASIHCRTSLPPLSQSAERPRATLAGASESRGAISRPKAWCRVESGAAPGWNAAPCA
jgi:hypothetical protein